MEATTVRDMPELELALLQRSLSAIASACQRCDRCRRTLLVGERIYEYASGAARCELCRPGERSAPAHWHTIHGPELGHTIRIIDQRAA